MNNKNNQKGCLDISQLQPGAILACKLTFYYHTGVYIGNGKAAELQSCGTIREVDLSAFRRTADAIYVACKKQCEVLFDQVIADRAIEKIDKCWGYHLLKNNCHQFTSGCLDGDLCTRENLLYKLEPQICAHYQLNECICWAKICC